MKFKLGKHAPKSHPRTLSLANYLPTNLAPAPEKVFWEYKIDPATIGMFGNDTVGDCTCAMVAHWLMLITAHTGKTVTPELQEVLDFYSAVSGYDQKTGANDNGAAITDVLEHWRTVGLSGHKIRAWAAIDYTNDEHVKQGIYVFGANGTGVQLPESAQDQFQAAQNWEVVDGSPIEGGHAILETGKGSDGSNYQSWGKGDQKASNAWSAATVDEKYVVITDDWIDEASGLTPSGFKMDELLADIKALG